MNQIIWIFKNNNLSPFYDIQVERGLEFISKISGLPCQEPALKRFWSLTCDYLTMSENNNSFELTVLQNNGNDFRIKIKLLH